MIYLKDRFLQYKRRAFDQWKIFKRVALKGDAEGQVF
jgi:hypothetical protein